MKTFLLTITILPIILFFVVLASMFYTGDLTNLTYKEVSNERQYHSDVSRR